MPPAHKLFLFSTPLHSPSLSLQVLTDYEALPRVFHNIENSAVRRCATTGATQLVQTCRWSFLLFRCACCGGACLSVVQAGMLQRQGRGTCGTTSTTPPLCPPL